ncbi:hypothetical protein EP7_002730 [Isosphaeraceae bacterium EP7]
MPDDAHRHLDALTQTDAYQARLIYRDAPRPHHAGATDSPTFAQLGHMLDTLKDAVLFMRHIGDEPALDVSEDHAYRHLNISSVPPYLERIASDPRRGSSFHRTDTGRSPQPKSGPDLAAFMNRLHALMRKSSLGIGRAFVIPPHLEADVRQYDAFIDIYLALLDRHRDPAANARDHRRLPPEVLDAFAAEFEPLADRLYAALAALPAVPLLVDGRQHSLPNGRPLNDRLKDTAPALVLFAFRTLGLGAADKNKRPATLEYDKRQRELIGAQSMITDTTQALLDLAAAQSVTFAGCPPDPLPIAAPYARSFQLALTFVRTAGCTYPAMETDLAHLIHLSGAPPGPITPETPQEAALLLYALDRRLARHDQAPSLRVTLRAQADAINTHPDLPAAQSTLRQDPAFHQDLDQIRIHLDPNFCHASASIDQLQALFPGPSKTAP